MARKQHDRRIHAAETFIEHVRARPGRWLYPQSSRVVKMRYDFGLQQIQVVFRDGTPWVYRDVPVQVWNSFRRSTSQGAFINRVLNDYPYHRGPSMFEEVGKGAWEEETYAEAFDQG